MMVGTCVSRVLGLAREIVTAAFFGASAQLDAFNVAYTLANLARQLVAEGALSAAFVPVFSRALTVSRNRALSLARQAMSVLLIASSLVTVLGILGAPLLTLAMAPGFDADIVVYDPAKKVTFTQAGQHASTDHTIWEGTKITGYPVLTLVRGRAAYRDGEFVGEKGAGRFVRCNPVRHAEAWI
jgi:N-acyl-D-aspartate/D-glutamate deacylase